jgi:hypothetical protein
VSTHPITGQFALRRGSVATNTSSQIPRQKTSHITMLVSQQTWEVRAITALLIACLLLPPSIGRSEDLTPALQALRAVGPHGQGHPEAIQAARRLQQLDATHLTTVLAAMDDANPLAVNWIRGVAETLAQNSQKSGKPLPLEDLEKFLAQTGHHPRARRLAYELILSADSTAQQRLTPTWIDDPSLELRRDAVQWLLDQAAEARDAGDKEGYERRLREAFHASRDIDQVQAIAQQLRQADLPADTAAHLGFILTWNLIGPFDNTDTAGFDIAYPPENEINLQQQYAGKNSQVAWKSHITTDDYGVVNLNEALGKAMGVIAYAHAEFISDTERDIELRLGSINATKVWLNGQLLASYHIYHTNVLIDQYIGQGRLKKGSNSILVKIAQNEQTEEWAQDWMFQLRVCDAIGTAVHSKDRSAAEVSQVPATRQPAELPRR